MTDHLPECPCIAVGVPSCICDNDEECGPQCRHHCICSALRACEERVREEFADHARDMDYSAEDRYRRGRTDGVRAARDAGYDEGYAAALVKSREAVAPFVTQDCGVDDCTRHYSPALGAIDRLIRAAGQAPAVEEDHG